MMLSRANAKIVERFLAVNVVNVVEPNGHEDPRMAEPDDGWLADDALFPPRPPIRSHRAPRPRRRHWRLTALALMLPVAAFGSSALAQPIGSQPTWVPETSTPSPYDPTDQAPRMTRSEDTGPSAPSATPSVTPSTRPLYPLGPAPKPLGMSDVSKPLTGRGES